MILCSRDSDERLTRTLPASWQVGTVGDIAKVKGGKRLPTGSSLVDGPTPHPYIRVSDMKSGTVDTSRILYVPANVAPAIRNYRVNAGDLFISVAGTLGIVGIIPKELHCANLTENADRITGITCDNRYLFYSLASDGIQNKISAQQTTGAQPKLALGRILRFEVALPPLAEQRAIATALSDMDALIAAQEKLIAKKRDIKTATMQQLLTGRKRLPGFFEKWTSEPFGNLAIDGPKNGYSGRASEIAPGTPTLKLSATTSGRLILTEETVKRLYETIPEGSDLFLRTGDLLIQRSNTFELVGTTAVYDGPPNAYIYPDLMSRVRLCSYELSQWLHLYLSSRKGRQELQSLAAGSTGSMPKLSGQSLRSLQIPCPPAAERIAIVEISSDMDAEITALEARLAKLRDIKQGMMQELLTGRTRLI